MYFAPLAGDGGPGITFRIVDNAVIDTPALVTAEGTQTDFNIEQSDSPYFSLKVAGTTTFTADLYGVSPTELAYHFGGTLAAGATSADPDTWSSPDSFAASEKTVVLVQLQGGYVRINRGVVTATLDWAFKKNDLPKIKLSIAVLKPVKNGVPSIFVSQAVFAP